MKKENTFLVVTGLLKGNFSSSGHRIAFIVVITQQSPKWTGRQQFICALSYEDYILEGGGAKVQQVAAKSFYFK